MDDGFRMRRVLFLQKPEFVRAHAPIVAAFARRAGDDIEVVAAGSPDEVPAGSDFDVVITPTLPWLPQALSRAGSYRWIHFLSAGVDAIWEMPFEKDGGVVLTKSSGVHGTSIAEYVVGSILFFAKSFDRYVAQGARREWSRHWMDKIDGKSVLIVGLGHVGTEIARRCSAFGMRVAGVQRTPRPSPFVDAVHPMEVVDGLLGDVDYLVVALPLTRETRGWMSGSRLARLKENAVVVDVSRGGVVDHSALLERLEAGLLRGAALDVFEAEPLPADSPLWARPNVLVTPHVSGTTPNYIERAMEIFLDNFTAYREGRPLTTPVRPEAGY